MRKFPASHSTHCRYRRIGFCVPKSHKNQLKTLIDINSSWWNTVLFFLFWKKIFVCSSGWLCSNSGMQHLQTGKISPIYLFVCLKDSMEHSRWILVYNSIEWLVTKKIENKKEENKIFRLNGSDMFWNIKLKRKTLKLETVVFVATRL